MNAMRTTIHAAKKDRGVRSSGAGHAEARGLRLRGDVMLISLLILLAILLGFSVAGMILAVGESQGEAVSLSASTSRQAAAACMEAALDKIGRDADYEGNESLTVGSSTCMIFSVVSSTTWTLRTEATIVNEVSRQEVILSDLSPVTILSWSEVASF